jgi:hypothetical protein
MNMRAKPLCGLSEHMSGLQTGVTLCGGGRTGAIAVPATGTGWA